MPTYSKIVSHDLWEGIDLTYSGTVNLLKHEFIVQPGADPARIRLAYRGASARVNEAGQLEVSTPAGDFQDDAPIAYQEVNGQRVPVAVSFALDEAQGVYGFHLGAYDPALALVIDPAMLVYCGFIGGSGYEYGFGIAVDAAGNAYVTGDTIVDLAGNVLAGDGLNSGTDFPFDFTVQAVAAPATLPDTGFPQGQITLLPAQPAEKAYTQSDLWLEIPKLGGKTDIVGVPQVDGDWDVTWLGSQAGWLEGSAFPTWAGNTVLTGHVWGANNNPGVFVNLKTLQYGDKILIHAWGQVYTYEARESRRVNASNVSSVMKPEKLDWLTLVTCEDYRVFWNTYSARRMVRAVLVSIK